MARPTKYTPETVAKLVEAIKMGATYELAAGYAGIHYDTFNEWMKKKSEFSEAIKKAEGVAAMVWLAKIEKSATEGEWQAAAWKLERRYPHAYGKTVQAQEHSGMVQVEHGISTDDPEVAALARALIQRLSGGGKADTGGAGVPGE